MVVAGGVLKGFLPLHGFQGKVKYSLPSLKTVLWDVYVSSILTIICDTLRGQSTCIHSLWLTLFDLAEVRLSGLNRLITSLNPYKRNIQDLKVIERYYLLQGDNYCKLLVQPKQFL